MELPTSSEIRQGVENRAGPFYEPQTQAGQYAENAGRMTLKALTALLGMRGAGDVGSLGYATGRGVRDFVDRLGRR